MNDDSQVQTAQPSQQPEREDTIFLFLKEMKSLFPVLELKEHFRATHRGLFVSAANSSRLLEVYQGWLDKQTAGEIQKSVDKIKKRLFGTAEPEKFYLIEGKNIMHGFLVAHELKEPQKFGIPFYLGSLTSAQNYIHPSDPSFSDLKDVEVITQGSKVSLRIKFGGSTFRAEPPVLEAFQRIAANSQRTLKEYPELEHSMAVLCKAFTALLRKSRALSPKAMLLVPQAYAQGKFTFRSIGKMIFVIDSRSNITAFYGLWGRALYRLLRREFSLVRGKRIGSFEIYSESHRLLGHFKYSRDNYHVTPQAVMDFYTQFESSPDKKDRFKGCYTAAQLFSRFSELFQTAQPIARHLIKNYAAKVKRPIREYRINGVWIFFISPDRVLESVVGKFTH